MSWKPKLWIKKEDFIRYESQLNIFNVYEFNIDKSEGVSFIWRKLF